VAAGAVVGATVVAVGSVVVVAPATVVGVVVAVDVEPELRFGRRNHTSAAVTTITASDASTATAISRLSRGGL
jgi:hypothetical protein